MKKVYIAGTGKYLPKKVLTNADLEKMVETTDEWITARTGIKSRHIIGEGESTSDLAFESAKEAIANAGVTAMEVDLIIVATISGDMQFPATACMVQEKLGAKKAVAFDISAACAGFPYALSIATQYLTSGAFENVLVIGAEALSCFVDWTDRSTCVLFGDGAGAAIVTNNPKGDAHEVLSDYLASDGSYADLLKTPGGGSCHPVSKQTIEDKLHYVKMEGKAVFKIAVESMVDAVNTLLKRNNLTLDDIQCLIPHQANLRIIKAVGKGVGISEDKVYVNVDRYGNMSSATTIVALYDAVEEGKIKKGDLVMLVAFGGGFVWGSTLIRW